MIEVSFIAILILSAVEIALQGTTMDITVWLIFLVLAESAILTSMFYCVMAKKKGKATATTKYYDGIITIIMNTLKIRYIFVLIAFIAMM